MERVLQELSNAGTDLAPDPVHDLRVAIRRCRSIAEGLRSVDPDRTWNKMRKASKVVFGSLGELRDVQVMLEWVQKLGTADDKTTGALLELFRGREQALKAKAAATLQNFDAKQWRSWSGVLAQRVGRVPLNSPVFQYLALERWEHAHALHRTALRNRSKVAFHALRIGLKKFRYIVENFLPERHRQWGGDLKELQDLLGEVHDLDVLWATAVQSRIFPDPETRLLWQKSIAEERRLRLRKYHDKMVGKASLWPIWRAGLPSGPQLEKAVSAKLKTWASFLDPDPKHAERVTRFALQLHRGLIASRVWDRSYEKTRTLLQSAALLHEVGRAKGSPGHHKASARLIGKIDPPLGWAPEDLSMAALIARYHRGALPQPEQKALGRLSPEQQRLVKQLAGVLRLADALDAAHEGNIRRVQVKKTIETIVVYADGFNAGGPLAERIAAARYLLEQTVGLPIVVREGTRSGQRPVASGQ
jgi:exopolyphosphatase/guanosine-5'-triphosphate,3'-diphosphate pyrophosphatase